MLMGKIGDTVRLVDILAVMLQELKVPAIGAIDTAATPPTISSNGSPQKFCLLETTISRIREFIRSHESVQPAYTADIRAPPVLFDAATTFKSLEKMGTMCKQCQGIKQLCCRVHERFTALLLVLSATDATHRGIVESDFMKAFDDFYKVMEKQMQYSAVLYRVATSLWLVKRVYEVHCCISDIYAKLGIDEDPEVPAGWLFHWDADRTEHLTWLQDTVGGMSTAMLVGEIPNRTTLDRVCKTMKSEINAHAGYKAAGARGTSAASSSLGTSACMIDVLKRTSDRIQGAHFRPLP